MDDLRKLKNSKFNFLKNSQDDKNTDENILKIKKENDKLNNKNQQLEQQNNNLNNKNQQLEQQNSDLNNKNQQLEQQNSDLNNKYQQLEQQNSELIAGYNQIKKSNAELSDSYNILFNYIFVYHKLTPISLIDNNRQLILELLEFIDNVCKKYNLKWWLYAGSLLGAVRHEGFIPWDDDCDINMIRPDYERFLEIIDLEIKNHGLEKFILVKNASIINNTVYPFTKIDYWVDGYLLGFIDIFPSDYVAKIDENIKENFLNEYKYLREELKNGADRNTTLETIFKKLNITFEKQDHVITGVEGDYNFFSIYETEDIFPLKTLKFENKEFPCPNDENYIKSLYGDDYMRIPKNIKIHDFHARLMNTPNCNDKLIEHINILKEINRNFK